MCKFELAYLDLFVLSISVMQRELHNTAVPRFDCVPFT